MAQSATLDTEFRRGERVIAADDMPGVPRGTPGRVLLVNGFSWIRYRVLFENGVDRGSINGSELCRPGELERVLAAREQAAAQVATGDSAVEAVAVADGAQSSGATVNGVQVPAHLIERSKRARERLAG